MREPAEGRKRRGTGREERRGDIATSISNTLVR
jgi:hypothetical protein